MVVCACGGFDSDGENSGTNESGAAPAREGRAGGRDPRGDAPLALASSVTRHEDITREKANSGWNYLVHGVDTLDLGVSVVWGLNWSTLLERLITGKAAAAGKSAVQWDKVDGEESWITASGKPPMYRFHLRTQIGEVFIAKSGSPGRSPNVYVSLWALAIWQIGIHGCIAKLGRMIRKLGGRILKLIPSRCDLCLDLRIEGGLSLDFLNSHIVAHSRKTHLYRDGDRLETFYLGDSHSAVQLRLYNKGLKVRQDLTWMVFREVWKTSDLNDIWRIEFQLRRPFLHERGVNSVGDLFSKLGSIWAFLTEDWCSLRLPGDSNTTRRPIQEDWKLVQACGARFGRVGELQRCTGPFERPTPEWHQAHIGGCATSYGAARGFDTWEETLQDLCRALNRRRSAIEYEQDIKTKKVKMGRMGLQLKDTYPEGWDEV